VPTAKAGQGTAGTSTPVPLQVSTASGFRTRRISPPSNRHLEVPQNHNRRSPRRFPRRRGVRSPPSTSNRNQCLHDDGREQGGPGAAKVRPRGTNINLSQPLSGYNGVQFTISLFVLISVSTSPDPGNWLNKSRGNAGRSSEEELIEKCLGSDHSFRASVLCLNGLRFRPSGTRCML